ncbi:MAG: serine/threonine-protein kinase, partial [Mycobacteriales bacterium]
MTWKVSGYAAEELIGFGASGEVWRGVEIATGEVVALKRLREVSEPARDRLRREAAVMAELDHPHLLRLRAAVRDTTDDATVETLVVDYAARGSLAALLRVRPRLTPGEVVTIIAPIAAALAYVHDEGLVHGDVAPANILFTSEGRPMLADLGIARALGADGPAAATPDYLDPVIARGGAPGQRSDVFSLAAVAFHALTGVPPWNASAPEDTISVARGGEPPDLASLAPDVPAELVETVRRGLALDPGARGSAAELALDVRCSCRPEPVDLADARASAV